MSLCSSTSDALRGKIKQPAGFDRIFSVGQLVSHDRKQPTKNRAKKWLVTNATKLSMKRNNRYVPAVAFVVTRCKCTIARTNAFRLFIVSCLRVSLRMPHKNRNVTRAARLAEFERNGA